MFSASRIVLRRTLSAFQRTTLQRSLNPQLRKRPTLQQYQNFCTKLTPPEVEPTSVPLAKLEKKFQMIYTCKVCSTRNSQTISQLAYKKGVVIVRCSGCNNNHLVADNLGWFRDAKTNIEDILKEKGEQVQKVSVGNEILELVNKSQSDM